MKNFAIIAVLVSFVFTVGCTQKEQVKVTFLSDPPGGTLYEQNGEVLGPCPKTLWYDIDSEAMEKGYLDAKGMVVRWPSGPAKRNDDLIKITVNGTDRRVIFVQPRNDPTTVAAEMQDENEELKRKAVQWQKAQKSYSAETERIKASMALISKKPVMANKAFKSRPGRTLTLGPKQLMLLDYSSLNRRGARVEGKRVVPGPGVEFDIYFPSNNPGSCSLSFVSSGTGGRGSLVGADISLYEAFALRITLVSINGRSDPEMKQRLVAGAVIGPTAQGRLTSYEPVKMSMAPSEKTVTAITEVSAEEVYEIGFHVHVEHEDYQDWDAAGSRMVLRIEPVEGGEAGTFNVSIS
ncbi:MAG: hypothetical protein JSW59_20285 [Phycisphaerales bacterium]|nr:MAG: hypothetical protein JSW59_20285 [Phycisphaerales bacterium]